MKLFVRHAGHELMVPSFRDFQAMYRNRIIGDDDEVRREGSERWMRAGDLPELRAIHLYDRGTHRWARQAMWLLVGLVALAVLGQLVWVWVRPH